MNIDKIREELLAATLGHVPFDGWSGRALKAGAAAVGLDAATALNAFPGGPAELLEYFSTETDRRMLAELETRDLAAMKVRARIATAVRARLEQLAPHREAARRALSFLALPRNAALGARCLYRTVDAIWYAAGDTATDFNFYTKRGLLAAVYSSTMLYWLNDRSDGFADTHAFLDRRIADVMKVPQQLGRVRQVWEKMPSPFRLMRGFPFRPARPRN